MNSATLRKRGRDAFSLIEVVLAIGVVSFALVGIFSLFSASLRTDKDASAQQEGTEVIRMITTYLQDTNVFGGTGLSNLFMTIWYQNTTTNYFVYASNNNGVLTTICTNEGPASMNSYVPGTLYYVVLANTSNAPSSIYTNSTNPPVNQTNWTSWPSLPLHASVYSIPSREMTNARFISNSVPVVSFDFIIPK